MTKMKILAETFFILTLVSACGSTKPKTTFDSSRRTSDEEAIVAEADDASSQKNETEPVTVALLKEAGILPAWFGEVTELPIPREHIVVYSKDDAEHDLSDDEVAIISTAVLELLNRYVEEKIEQIDRIDEISGRWYWHLIKYLENYWVRISGPLEGKDTIGCTLYQRSFSEKQDDDHFRETLKSSRGIIVMGGGESVWHIIIDVKNKKIVSSQFNADK